MKHNTLLTAAVAAVMGLGVAAASPVAIVNPSFECDILPPPTTTPSLQPSGFGSASCANPGWLKTDPSGDSLGVWRPIHGGTGGGAPNPSASQYPDPSSTLPGDFVGQVYANGVPDGFNFAYISYGLFHQVLVDNVQAGFTYTLKAFVGTRWDNNSSFCAYDSYCGDQGYFMELGAYNSWDPSSGSLSRTTLSRIRSVSSDSFFNAYPSVNSPDDTMPGYGQWHQISISYTVGANDPTIGKPLLIVFGAPGRQADIDMVTLDAVSSIPEPASFGLVLGGIALAGLKLWRRRK